MILNVKLKVIFVFVLLGSMNCVYAQYNEEHGTPFFRNYPPREYHGYSQNWSIVQSITGLLYFANGDGVMEYDGSDWRMVSSKTKINATSLVIDPTGKIYVGAIGDFGYLKPNNSGRMEFVSLLSRFPVKLRDFSFVYNTLCVDGGVYFNTAKGLYRWKNDKISFWPLTKGNSIFNYKNKICVWQDKRGVSYLEKEKFKSFCNGLFKDSSFIAILPYDKLYDLVVTRSDGMFLLSKDHGNISMQPFSLDVNRFYRDNRMVHAIQLKDGKYAVASMRGGTIVFNKSGHIELVLNKSIGIMNDSHNSIMQDFQGNLWIALDNGLSKIELLSPLSYWDDASGLKGSVLNVIRNNGMMYAATWQGLYKIEESGNQAFDSQSVIGRRNSFRVVDGLTTQCWDLLSIDATSKQELLVASTNGIYVCINDKPERIFESTTYKFLKLKRFPDLFFAATNSGIAVFKIVKGNKNKYISLGFIAGIDFKSNSIVEDKNGNVWFDVNNNSIGYLKMSRKELKKDSKDVNQLFDIKLRIYNREKFFKGVGQISVNSLFGNPIILSNKGVFKPVFHKNQETIIPLFSSMHEFFSNNYELISFSQDNSGRIWFQVSSKINKVKVLGLATVTKSNDFQFVFAPFKPIPSMEIFAIYPEKDGKVWIGGDDGLFMFNSKRNTDYHIDYKTLLREVRTKKDSVLFQGFYAGKDQKYHIAQPDSVRFELSHEYNSFKFNISAPVFFDERFTEYSWFLEGHDGKWTEWSKISEKEYTNLPHGDYVFHAKSRDLFGNEGEEAIFRFSISPPWYLTTLSKILYIVLFVIIIYVGNVIMNQRLLSAKIRLERVVRDRTSEVIARQKEIEQEKDRSEKLLLNILPYKVAEELKNKGSASTQFYQSATVMFSDMKGFTTISQTLSPEQLIKELDKRFVMFDDICLRKNIEKIKTIGDAYMCVGGVPIVNNTHPVDVVLAAIEMLDFIEKLNAPLDKEEMPWELRVGIHSGPIIAGVVGRNKFAYDIWGDTVNTASRMESSSVAGKINISGFTYDLIKDFFICNYRGKIPVKNKGEIDMFFVERIKPELSNDIKGHMPNKDFMDLYNLLANRKDGI